MDTKEKIAHLLRRFGLGAGRIEVERYSKYGLDGTIERLIHYEKIEEPFEISPWEFVIQQDQKTLALDPFHIAAWWAVRMVLTQRPLQHKLALFWHDHFAVSGAKVDFGPMMLQYLETLLRHANGNFRTLLGAISRNPAMMRWLDNDTNVKKNPNENFARELLELFTLGIGNYTEKDVKEVARAFTGWFIFYTVSPGFGQSIEEQVREAVLQGRSITHFAVNPEAHDNDEKTIFGKKGNFDGGQVLDILAEHPKTASFITRKLWEWFAYPNPEKHIQEKLERAYFDGKYEIKKILEAMVETDEFWSSKCVRRRIKSPVDFSIALLRQVDITPLMLFLRKPDATPFTPPNPILVAVGQLLIFSMQTQGMLLLYPPDVGGWEWGNAWIESGAMMERIRTAEHFFGDENDPRLSEFFAGRIKETSPSDLESAVRAILDYYDAALPDEKVRTLVKAAEKAGGLEALSHSKSASRLFRSVCRVLFATPEFHFV